MTDVNIQELKTVIRQSSTTSEAIEKLKARGLKYDRHSLRKTLLKNGAANISAYLNGGAEASLRGDHPGHGLVNEKPTAPGYVIKGVSSLVDAEGNTKLQWVKTRLDTDQQIEILRDAIKYIAEPIAGTAVKVQAPKTNAKDILTVYPMGDPHLGMYSWHKETGEDFDLKIAETHLFGAVDHLVGQAPPSEKAVIVNLGDFFHSDSMDNRTRRSGNALDVDGRFPKVLAAGVRTLIRCIYKALEKHKEVAVINAIGNHDDHSAIMLSLVLQEHFRDNPRVVIDTAPTPQHYYRFGKVLLGVTHGHEAKPDKLAGVMACDRARDWGDTKHRYWLTGHVHHDSRKDYAGVSVESFRTLAPKDAWANASGYRSDRDMKCIVYHSEFGEISRYTSNIELIKSLSKTTEAKPKSNKR